MTYTPSRFRPSTRRRGPSAAERFWGLVDKESSAPCWVWRGPVDRSGSPIFRAFSGVPQPAHRFAWRLGHGTSPPSGLRLERACSTLGCVRCDPDHWRPAPTIAREAEPVRQTRDPGELSAAEREDFRLRFEGGATIRALSLRFGLSTRDAATFASTVQEDDHPWGT